MVTLGIPPRVRQRIGLRSAQAVADAGDICWKLEVRSDGLEKHQSKKG
jgi:hypothetical protein